MNNEEIKNKRKEISSKMMKKIEKKWIEFAHQLIRERKINSKTTKEMAKTIKDAFSHGMIEGRLEKLYRIASIKEKMFGGHPLDPDLKLKDYDQRYIDEINELRIEYEAMKDCLLNLKI